MFDHETPPAFHLRPLAVQLPVLTHPHTEQILVDARRWIVENLSFTLPDDRKYESLLDEVDYIGCLYAPHLPDKWSFFVVTFAHYLGSLDTQMSNRASIGGSLHATRYYAQRMLADMVGWIPEPDRTLPFSETWRQLRQEMPARRWARFIAACDRGWNGFLHDVESIQAQQGAADVEAYLRSRCDSAFVAWIFPLLEQIFAPDVPEALIVGGDMAAIHDIILDHQALASDLFSYRKEYYAGELVNAIEVIQRVETQDLQAAVDRVVDLIDHKEQEFIVRRTELLRTQSGCAGLARYLDELGYLMSGVLAWSYGCRRYHGTGSGGDGSVPGILILWPDRTEFRPDPDFDADAAAGGAGEWARSARRRFEKPNPIPGAVS